MASGNLIPFEPFSGKERNCIQELDSKKRITYNCASEIGIVLKAFSCPEKKTMDFNPSEGISEVLLHLIPCS
jgi:hypothetical protein